jgi:putative membrane protein
LTAVSAVVGVAAAWETFRAVGDSVAAGETSAAEARQVIGEMREFSEDDLQKIHDAVREAERRTRGEIVPMVVHSSARYRETAHLVGLVASLIVLTLLLVLDAGWGTWGWTDHHPGWIVLGVLGAYIVGSWIGSLPWCIRMFTSSERMAFKVLRRAELAFYEHGLHKTREGTGILIMVSLLERRAQILADKAINERVPPGTWDALVQDLVRGFKAGRPTEAFCLVIARCGNLLAAHFPAREGDNPDELPDDLIQEP